MKVDIHLTYAWFCKYTYKHSKKNERKSVYFLLNSCQNFPNEYITLFQKGKIFKQKQKGKSHCNFKWAFLPFGPGHKILPNTALPAATTKCSWHIISNLSVGPKRIIKHFHYLQWYRYKMSNIISDLSAYMRNTVKKRARFPNTH